MLFKISLARHICRGDEIRPLGKRCEEKEGEGDEGGGVMLLGRMITV